MFVEVHRSDAGDRLRVEEAMTNDSQTSHTLCEEHVAVGKKGEAPRILESFNNGDDTDAITRSLEDFDWMRGRTTPKLPPERGGGEHEQDGDGSPRNRATSPGDSMHARQLDAGESGHGDGRRVWRQVNRCRATGHEDSRPLSERRCSASSPVFHLQKSSEGHFAATIERACQRVAPWYQRKRNGGP